MFQPGKGYNALALTGEDGNMGNVTLVMLTSTRCHLFLYIIL